MALMPIHPHDYSGPAELPDPDWYSQHFNEATLKAMADLVRVTEERYAHVTKVGQLQVQHRAAEADAGEAEAEAIVAADTKSTKAARDKRQHADELKKELEAAEQRHIVYDQARNRARTKVYEAVQAEPTSEHAATLTALAADELAEAERLTQQRDAAAARSRDYAKAAAGMHHFPRALPADGTPFWADLDAERAWAGDKAALQLMVDYIANLERGPVGPPTKGRENEFDTRRVNPYLNYYG